MNPAMKSSQKSTLRLLGWICVVVLIQAVFVFRQMRDSSSKTSAARKSSFSGAVTVDRATCESGGVYVYDLPPKFNKELLDNCQDLNPWRSRCPEVSNLGFGPKATNLDGIVHRNISSAWYYTSMDTSEVIYHSRMLSYKCRTLNPDEATSFYIPFYAGLSLGKLSWSNHTERDRPGEAVLEWLRRQPTWRRHDGGDHFIVLGRLTWDFRRGATGDSNWGSRFINMPLMKNVMKISVEKSPWDETEYSVPYPTSFHPRSESDVAEWQRYIRSKPRSSLFSIVGAFREASRSTLGGFLAEDCKSQPAGICKAVDCSQSECSITTPETLEAYLDSDFCLQPEGNGTTRRSMFECIVAGSIPVFFWEKGFDGQDDWHLPPRSGGYSVFIDHRDVRSGKLSMREKLEGFGKAEVGRMRDAVVDLLPQIVYAENSLGDLKDAFDVTVEKVLRRMDFNFRKKPSF